jgi:energy-coupling factor transport system ATP-binding protein
VEINRATIRRDRTPILHDISLAIGTGEVVALMGRNGSGKTTLLRSLFGFESVQAGSIRVSGLNPSVVSANEIGRRVAWLPQRSSAVLFNPSVQDELAFTRRHRGPGKNDRIVFDALDVGPILNVDPRDLSEGQRLRAAIAAALIGEPGIIVLDEPTRGLDGVMRDRMVQLIKDLQRSGSTILLATHDVDLVAMVAGRVVMLGGGEIVADDTVDAVLGSSLTYSPSIRQVFGSGFFTVQDVVGESRSDMADTSLRHAL